MAALSCLIFATLVLSLAQGLPQGYGPSGGDLNLPDRPRTPVKTLPPGCKIQHKTIYEVIEKEEFETKCEKKYKVVCEEQLEKICNPYQEEVCQTVNEQKCDNLFRDKCYEAYKDVQEEYQEEECHDKYVKKCEKHWEVVSETEKIWADNPATCKDLKETECNPVIKYRTKKEPYQKCDKEPYTNCYNVPRKVCDYVTREKCNNQPRKICNDVPYDDCQEVHKLVPHQVAKLKAFKVCDHLDDPYELSDQELVDYDIIDQRIGAVPDDQVEVIDVENLEESTTKSSSAILFSAE